MNDLDEFVAFNDMMLNIEYVLLAAAIACFVLFFASLWGGRNNEKSS